MKFLSTGFSLLFSLTSISVFANDYTLSLENGGTTDPTLEVGNVVNIALDSPKINQMIWGNVQIDYDPTMLQAQYVDETAIFYGFFTYWTHAPANGVVCGGGVPYYYTTGGGSDRADRYAARYGEGSGPSAYIDHANGTIRFYQGNYLYPGYYEPLRLGFKVLKTGTTTLTVRSETETSYDWCNFDTVTPVDFTFGQP